MSAPRFLALAGDPDELRSFLATTKPGEAAPARLNRVFDAPDLVLFASPETALLALDNERGLVIGHLFTQGETSERVRRLARPESARAAETGGKSLLTRFWGGYVALTRHGGRISVLRDPSAAMPVYRRAAGGIDLFFSDGGLCGDLPLPAPTVDEDFLLQRLSFPFLRTARTGLAGTLELLPGELYRAGANLAELAWSPWDAAAPERRIDDFETAAKRLRATILRTVPPQVAARPDLALELSGGLDSSVVAAALAHAGIRLPAANFVTRMADGDERHYAEAVASALGLRLAKVEEDLEPLDLAPPAPDTLRPPPSIAVQGLNRVLAAFARQGGIRGFVTGAGGDNLFCYITTAAPILDAAADLAIARAVRTTLPEVAALGGCTVWTAGRYAVRKAFRRRPLWPQDVQFLAPAAIAAAPDRHPWLDAPAGTPTGTREHVESLVRAHHFLEPAYSSGETLIHPLISQPLMELCLAIPSWLWVRGGYNRAVARRAFEDLLPAAVIHRRSKGRIESMCARTFEGNRRRLADLLLGGELARRQLLDTKALAAYLNVPGPAPDHDYFRIFELVSLELWLRSHSL